MAEEGKRWTVRDREGNAIYSLVAIAVFGFDISEQGETIPNNFVATAFLKHIRLKGNTE